MKVWLVTTEMAPFAGGIGVYALHTARMLAAGGVEATVFVHDTAIDAATAQWIDGYRLIRFHDRAPCGLSLRGPQLHGCLGAAYAACEMLKQAMAEQGPPDVVEFQDYGALGYFFLKHRLMEMGDDAPRVILTAHRPYVHCAETDGDSVHDHRTAFLGDAERWCYAAADAVFAPCEFIVQALSRPGMDFPFRDSDVHVVRNPFDAATLRSAPPDALAAPHALELSRRLHTRHEPVLFFGKLQAQKGVWEAAAAISALAGEGRRLPLWLWGRDALHAPSGISAYDFLERRYRRHFGQGLIRYFGDYRPATVQALCREHPVCLLPYREECLPYAFIEVALAGGLPLIGATGGQVELVPPDLRERLVVDVARPDQVGDRIAALQALDAGERRRLSDALAAEVARQTDYAAVLSAKLQALERVQLRSLAHDYPFVHGEALCFPPLTPERQADLAGEVPQRGATTATRTVKGATTVQRDGLISVVIPYYEMHDHIEETLASVEAQGWDAVEVVIVDDGSHTPAAKAKLDAILAAPRRFPTTVLRKYNGGLADARNAGAKIAAGRYLYFLDADDLIHPATLARSIAVLQRFRNVSYVGAWLREFGEGDREWLVWDLDGPYLGFHNLQICSFLVRAEAWLRFGVNDPAMSLGMEDYDSHLRMLSHGVRGVALPQVYFNYRIRSGSMSRAFDAHSKAFLYRQLFRNHAGFYARHGARLAPMFAENGHGALAGPPTAPGSPTLGLPARAPPDVEAIERQLELTASREGLSEALRGLALEGGVRWRYVVGRLLLALDLEPAFAERLLAAAAQSQPDNGWPCLYAMIAQLRAGRFAAADGLWSPALSAFCRTEREAVLWIAEFEAVRGWPHVELALHAMLSRRLGWGLVARAASTALQPTTPTCDARFTALRHALGELQRAAGDPGRRTPDSLREAVDAVFAAAAPLASEQATRALLQVWRRSWSFKDRGGEGTVARLTDAIMLGDDDATMAAEAEALGFWDRPALAYLMAEDTDGSAPALTPDERQDAHAWAAACAQPPVSRQPEEAAPGRAPPAGHSRSRERIARLGRLLR